MKQFERDFSDATRRMVEFDEQLSEEVEGGENHDNLRSKLTCVFVRENPDEGLLTASYSELEE